MKLLFAPLLFSFLVFGLTTKSQARTEKDFRLLIDGKTYSDSINIVSVSDLLKMYEVTANFSWITVKSIVIYYQKPFCEAVIKKCSSNIICNDAKELMKKIEPGNVLTIAIEDAVNKQEIKVHLKEIVFRII